LSDKAREIISSAWEANLKKNYSEKIGVDLIICIGWI
jgi:hypothetical protein